MRGGVNDARSDEGHEDARRGFVGRGWVRTVRGRQVVMLSSRHVVMDDGGRECTAESLGVRQGQFWGDGEGV